MIKIIIIFIVLVVIAIAPDPKTRNIIVDYIGNFIYELKLQGMYKTYMKEHPEPCDNVFIAYEAAKKSFLEDIYYSEQWKGPNFIKPEFYSKHVEILDPENTKSINYKKNPNCKFMFMIAYSNSDYDNINGGQFEMHIQYKNNKWNTKYYKPISYTQFKSIIKEWTNDK